MALLLLIFPYRREQPIIAIPGTHWQSGTQRNCLGLDELSKIGQWKNFFFTVESNTEPKTRCERGFADLAIRYGDFGVQFSFVHAASEAQTAWLVESSI